MGEPELRKVAMRLLGTTQQRVEAVAQLDFQEHLRVADLEVRRWPEELIGRVGHRREVEVVDAMPRVRDEGVRDTHAEPRSSTRATGHPPQVP